MKKAQNNFIKEYNNIELCQKYNEFINNIYINISNKNIITDALYKKV